MPPPPVGFAPGLYDIRRLRPPDSINGLMVTNPDLYITGINANGDVVGAADLLYDPGPPARTASVGLIWNRLGRLTFITPWGSSDDDTYLTSINRSGDAVGYLASAPSRAVLFSGGSPVYLSETLKGSLSGTSFSDVYRSQATDINDNGLICGQFWESYDEYVRHHTRSFIINSITWDVTWIDPMKEYDRVEATAINASGDVVGLYLPIAFGREAGFLYSSSVLKNLGPAYFVRKVNAAGLACGLGHDSIGMDLPAVWDTRAATPTPNPIPRVADAFGINNKGEVVGPGYGFAYVYNGTTTTDLNTLIADPRWHLDRAADINDTGQITGTGTFVRHDPAPDLPIFGYLMTPLNRFPLPAGFPPDWQILFTAPDIVSAVLGGFDKQRAGWPFPVGPGGQPLPGDAEVRWMALPPEKRDALLALALDEIAVFIQDRGTREAVRKVLIEAAKGRLDALGANALQP
jgi:hypothetical protein